MVLQDIYNMLRPHQRNAANALSSGVTRGQIILPTGVGKTYVQVHKILETLTSMKTPGTAVIASHRILLCEQLIKDVSRYALAIDLPFNILTVASDGMDMQDMAALAEDLNSDGNLMARCLVDRATANEDILNASVKARQLDRHLLVVSTYHSFDRMAGLHVDVACLDEAHTITEEDKYEKVKAMQPHMDQAFFFTATQVTGCNGRGMDNVSFYGQVLHTVAPRAAIDSRDILPPVIHSIKLEGGRPSYAQVIKAAYKAHREKVREQSHERAAPKLLVSVAGVEDMVSLLKDPKFHKWALESGVHTVGFSSSMGYFKNGLDVTRKEALQSLRELGDMDSAIIMHYDILTEGIDLPNITAVLPLRELCKVKFLQTLGRAARLQKDDRAALYSGAKQGSGVDPETGNVVIDPSMVKPCYWVIQNPMLNDQATDTNQRLIEIVREAYQVDPEERKQPQVSTSPSLEDADSVLDADKQTPQERAVASLTHEFEALLFLNMDAHEQKEFIEGLFSPQEGEEDGQAQDSQDSTEARMPEAVEVVPQGGGRQPGRPRKDRHDSFLGL